MSHLSLPMQRSPKAAAYTATVVILCLLAFKRQDAFVPFINRVLSSKPAQSRKRKEKPQLTKPVSHSAFTASYTMHPESADEAGRVFGGDTLKLVDVVAGIACRRHANAPCVTISLDRVIFLEPIMVGDVLHLSVSINRAWESSMEAGVRITKEDAKTGQAVYASHAYLTFVARPPPPPSPFYSYLSFIFPPFRAAPSHATKHHVPTIVPQTVLEYKRHLLAGRRRGHRINKRGQHWTSLLSRFRAEVLAFPAPGSGEDPRKVTEEALGNVQKEMVAEAWMKGDLDVRREGDLIVAEVEGFMERFSFPLAEIEKVIQNRGRGAFRRLSIPSTSSPITSPIFSSFPTGLDLRRPSSPNEWYEPKRVLEMHETVATSVHIVRPQHCNSMGVLFGGELMRWLEEVAALSARKVSAVSWSTATVDSMTFRASAHPGFVVNLRSIVVKVFDSSLECYSVATAQRSFSSLAPITSSAAEEDIFISDAFFTLVAIGETGRPAKGGLREVRPPEECRDGSVAADMVRFSEGRRQERLQEKAVLMKVYS